MAIKTDYNFKGIEIKDAYIRIDRIFGSAKEGWTALVGVYNITTEEVPAVEYKLPIGFPGEHGYKAEVEAKEAYTKEVYNLIEEFNHSASYVADERGYVSVYKSLTEKFGGIEI
jgi:hypothetical protein